MARARKILVTWSFTILVFALFVVWLSPDRRNHEPIRVRRLTAPSGRVDPPATSHAQVAIAEPRAEPRATLETSDELVRSLVIGLSSHPRLASLLIHDDLVRRFVAAVELVAAGYLPREQLAFLRPHEPFVVTSSGDDLVIAPGSYRRYDVASELFASIDVSGASALYRRLEPQIHEAHEEIAWYGADFDQRLEQAIDHLLEVEAGDGELVVERGILAYAFADPELERLSNAQRALLRMGPRNARRVQAKLRELRQELFGDGRLRDLESQPRTASNDATGEPSMVTEFTDSVAAVMDSSQATDEVSEEVDQLTRLAVEELLMPENALAP